MCTHTNRLPLRKLVIWLPYERDWVRVTVSPLLLTTMSGPSCLLHLTGGPASSPAVASLLHHCMVPSTGTGALHCAGSRRSLPAAAAPAGSTFSTVRSSSALPPRDLRDQRPTSVSACASPVYLDSLPGAAWRTHSVPTPGTFATPE